MQKNSSHKSLAEKLRISEGLSETQRNFLETYGPKKHFVFCQSLVRKEEVDEEISSKARNGWSVFRKGKKYGMVNIVFRKSVIS